MIEWICVVVGGIIGSFLAWRSKDADVAITHSVEEDIRQIVPLIEQCGSKSKKKAAGGR